jgi:hypothetical protein
MFLVSVGTVSRPQAQVLQQPPVAFAVDTKDDLTFTVGDTTVRILRATPKELVYVLQ